MPINFRKPDGLIGRFAVVKPWPDIQAAEDENIARLQITARSLGLECIVVDPEGVRLDAPFQMVTDRDVDFVINLHFETPKAYDAFSFVALWNPLRFFREWSYRRYSRNLLTHDDFLSCSSTWADDHVLRMLHDDPTRLPACFTMYHSLSEPIIEPTLGEQKVFYAGINWERLDKKKKGRHQDLLRCLDKDGVLRIHGPKLFGGINVWEGYNCYVGPLPFDGVSVVRAIAQAGISLVFSSDAHKESELMSNRLFESLAAGAVIICDDNPFALKFFGDRLLYVDSLAPMEQVREQILVHLAWIKGHPQEALAKARAAQALFKDRFTLDRSLATIYEQLVERKLLLSRRYAPLSAEETVHMLLVLPEFSEQAVESLVTSAISQRLVNICAVLLIDEGDYRTHGQEVQAKLLEHGLKTEVLPLPFFVRRSDGSCVRRQLLGRVLASVIESLPDSSLFLMLAPNERLFSDHVAAMLRSLQGDPEAGFAYSPAVLRHVLESKLTYDLLPELNVAHNWHLPPGFGRYLIRRSSIRPEQLAVMRYLDLHALKPIIGELKGVSSNRATLLSRIQEPFLSSELVDCLFEHEISLDHLNKLNGVADLKHVKPVLAHSGPATSAAVAPGITFQSFALQMEQRPRPNLRAGQALRRLRQTLLCDRVYQETVFAAAEAQVVSALRNELAPLSEAVMEGENYDGFLSYAAALCFEAGGDRLNAFRALNRALRAAAPHHPAQYLVRCALKLVRLALKQSETKIALQVLESVILKIQPNHRLAKELAGKLNSGTSPAEALKLLPSAMSTVAAPVSPKLQSTPPAISRASNPLVSVIVSAYKSERFLPGSLEDLEAQTIAKDIEIIVVDSDSPQEEKSIVVEFQKRYSNIVYIRTERTETVYGAWNRGIQAARGKYITNANTDDRHRRDALERMLHALEANPEIALVYGDCLTTTVENETFETTTSARELKWLDFDPQVLLEKGCFVGPQPMWRRDVHEEHGYFDDKMVSSGDYEFWLRIARTRDFLHMKETLGLYLESPASVQHANNDQAIRESCRAQDLHRAAIMARVNRLVPVATPQRETTTAPAPGLSGRSGAIVLPPCALQGRLNEARQLFSNKKLPAAWGAVRAALKQRTFHPEAYLLLAEIALAAHDSVAARACAQFARHIAPDFRPAKKFLKASLHGNLKPEWVVLPEEIGKQKTESRNRLSVCLIVKNEERFLGQCLASVKGLAHQIVVVDTGSTDRTVEIAREHGAEVHSFAWCDDFSAARNAALEHVTGDWVLMLDADEELPQQQHAALRKLLHSPSVIAWRLPLQDAGREAEGCSYVPRLFRNAPGLFYVGRVHEQVFSSVEVRRQEWGLETRLGDAMLRHYGYTKELTLERDKVGRNLRLLEQAILELPGESNLLMNYGLEMTRSGRREEGLAQYRAAFEAMADLPPAQVVPETREVLLTQFCTQLMAAKRHAEIVQVLASPLAKLGGGLTASLHFTLGLAQMELKEFAAAAEAFRQCLAKRDRPALTPVNLEIRKAGPRHCLALCLDHIGETDAASEEFRLAIETEPQSRPVRYDYARFLAAHERQADALNLFFALAGEKPGEAQVWLEGGRLALTRLEFLEVALDWTAEAERHLPDEPAVVQQRAEALMLAGQCGAALLLWRRWPAVSNHALAGALVLCETAVGENQFAPAAAVEAAVSREFLKWYQRLLQFNARPTVDVLNARIEILERILPSAAGMLAGALAEATAEVSTDVSN